MDNENSKENNREKKYAMLIDADNISPKYISIIMSESREFGEIGIRRVYGDWTDVSKGKWKDILLENSINPIQQYTYTTGKNSSDSAMIIDAMDILYGNQVDGFILVSSDSDFTRLAMRLREAGKDIVGMGESKTPSAFVKACRVFKTLDVLYNATVAVKNPAKKNNAKNSVVNDNTDKKTQEEDVVPITSIKVIKASIADMVDSKSEDDGWLFLGELGNYLLKEYPDFDCRNYGYKKLVELIKDCEQLEVKTLRKGRANLVYARIK